MHYTIALCCMKILATVVLVRQSGRHRNSLASGEMATHVHSAVQLCLHDVLPAEVSRH